jgi:CubicO group peptidase (beta-lactamase class C family)
MTMMLTLGILLSTVGPAMAQENRIAPGRDVPTAPSQGQGPTDPTGLEAFLDELLGRQMEEHHITGQLAMVPAGGMQASATDMGRFMIARLQDGRYSDAKVAEAHILKEVTVQQMHSTLQPRPATFGHRLRLFQFQ